MLGSYPRFQGLLYGLCVGGKKKIEQRTEYVSVVCKRSDEGISVV